MLVLVMLCMHAVFSADAFAETSTRKQIVRVGYYPNDDLIGNIKRAQSKGYGYEVLKKIESISDLKFEFIEVDGSMQKALIKGDIDLAGPYFKTEERLEKFLYAKYPLNSQVIALATKGDKKIYYDDPQSINGKTVATYPDSIAKQRLDEYLKENNISVNYVTNNLVDYLNVEADFYLLYSGDADAKDYYTALTLGAYYAFMITTPDKADIIAKIDNALEYIIYTEGSFFNDLYDEYLSELSVTHRYITRAESEKIQGKTFTVGYESKHEPYTYTDQQGNPNGAFIEIMDMLADEYGFNVEYIPLSLQDNQVNSEEPDIILSLVGDGTQETQGYVNTEPFYNIDMVAVASDEILAKTNNIFEQSAVDISVGMLQYKGVNFEEYIKDDREHLSIYFYESFDTLLNAYKIGEVDSAIFTANGIRYVNAKIDSVTDHILAVDFTVPAYMSFHEDIAAEFIPVFNVMFDNVKEQKYYDIMVGHMANYFPNSSIVEFLIQYWYLVAITIISLVLLLLISSLNQYRASKKAIQDMLETDDITKHISFFKFQESVKEMLKVATAGEYQLISLDIDLFRTINTHYSLEKGTAVINAISSELADALKEEDAIFARKTADNFIIMRKVTQELTIDEIVYQRIIPAIQKLIGTNYKLCMSIGIYVINDTSEKLHFMVDHADTARQSGKSEHKTTFRVFDQAMQKAYNNRLNITYRMDKALEEKEFFVIYQPKVDFGSLTIKGAEALVRWKTSEGKMIFPDQFIPEFEQNGFIAQLDKYVFEEVCKFIVKYHSDIQLPVISVNLSAVTFLDEMIAQDLIDIVNKYDVKPSEIELEITESAMNASEEEITKKVKYFKQVGFTISIDDFGAGVSSLNRLGMLDVDVIKMDKAFLDNNKEGTHGDIVIENTINLAKNLGMKVVAEGVETVEQATWLCGLGCNMAQGYFFERPMPADEFRDKMIENKSYVGLIDTELSKLMNVDGAEVYSNNSLCCPKK